MITGPPRPFFIVSTLLLLTFVWSCIQLKIISWTSSKRESPSLPTTTSPLDFSVPLLFKDGKPKPPGSNYSWVVVFPKTRAEDLLWFEIEVPEAQMIVYEVDNPKAEHTVPKNKGKEAMTYLTYLIDYYDDLPDIVIFLHAHKLTWHNNELFEKETSPMIKRLNHDRVARLGYMNLRCHHDPGCPDWIHLDRPDGDLDLIRKPEEQYWSRRIWEELHPGAPIPQSLSATCCAQFAVTRDRIRQVPIERFHHYREWLINTDLLDEQSGRIFEYLWHYMFTGHEVYCPAQNTCYCDGYGICFGGLEKYDEYAQRSIRREKDRKALEVLVGQVWEAESRGESGELIQRLRDKVDELASAISEADAWMRERRVEAFERGEDEESRTAETEEFFVG
ncbi:hypothetical protein DM02DRAFT_709587 [Periconia macrospinosa]|uniref:Uncharacterized protein n=1 Tax=Periconia macrospinosa TaxID=97972 RepID=A0A2V1DS27_9PLEO|nr:hypothetical protein DM02DRAFT_709587 [Periconia macrospinosa]